MPAPAQAGPHQFDVYGYRFQIVGDHADAIRNLAGDFRHFAVERPARGATIELYHQEPPYDKVPAACLARVYTPRCVTYDAGATIYLDYNGNGLGIFEKPVERFHVYSRDPDLLCEAAHLFLLARIARRLERRGFHRLHALALGFRGKAVLVLLPLRGGKSTLGWSLLRDPDFEVLSDDSPFLGSDGLVHAFPLRFGFLPGLEADLPAEHIRVIHRMDLTPKTLVRYEYFADRVRGSAEPGIVFLGARSLTPECRIDPAPAADGWRDMIRNCVRGTGLFQGVEFLPERGPWESAVACATALSRLHVSSRILRRSKVFRLVLGRDLDRNAATVAEFVRRQFPAAAK